MPDHRAPSITVLILAGGQGERMGGSDKGLVECAGRPLIEHVLARVAPCADAILISANRTLDTYGRYGYPVLEDTTADFSGPLAGIARGLEQCMTDWLWILPCDAPQVDAELLERLLDACRTQEAPAAVPIEGGRMHATCALLCRDTLPSLNTYLERDHRAVHAWLRTLPAAEIECDDHPEWFVNLNTPEELAAYAARLRSNI